MEIFINRNALITEFKHKFFHELEKGVDASFGAAHLYSEKAAQILDNVFDTYTEGYAPEIINFFAEVKLSNEKTDNIRKQVLDNAAKCVLQDRNNQYGEPEDVFSDVAKCGIHIRK